MPTKIQARRGTAAQWTAANTLLSVGEFGFETDTKKLKVGDGATLWASLPYIGSTGGGSTVTMDSDGTLTINGTPYEVALDSEVVHRTGDETVAGAKTFSAPVTVATPTLAAHAATKAYVDTAAGGGGAVASVVGQTGVVTGTQILADTTVAAALADKAADSTVVHVTGAENVAGIKTFSSMPLIPTTTPSAAGHVISKSALDAALANRTAYTPEFYGAAAAFDAAVDDTTFVQQALAAAQTNNGVLSLRRVYNVTAGSITVTSAVVIRGVGGVQKFGAFPRSGLSVDTLTGVGLTLDCSGGVQLENFAVVNRSTGTQAVGSTGILITKNTNTTVWNDFNFLSRADTVGFYNNIDIQAGSYWKYENSANYDAANHGMVVSNDNNPDGGDAYVTNNTLISSKNTGTSGAAICWKSGGGLKVRGNKINGPGATGQFSYGLWMYLTTSSTSIMMFQGNSVENVSRGGVLYTDNGNNFRMLKVNDNEFAFYGGGAAANGAVNIASTGGGTLTGLDVTSNTFNSGNLNQKYAVYVDGSVVQATVNSNVMCGTNFNGYYFGSGVQIAQYDAPSLTGTRVLVRDESVSSTSVNGSVGVIPARYSRGIVAAGKAAAVAQWSLGLADGDSLLLTCNIAGRAAGATTDEKFFIRAQRLLTRTGSAALTVSTVGTDVTNGSDVANIQYTFDTSTTTGEAILKLQIGSGSTATNLYGRYDITVEGMPRIVKRGAATTP